MSNQREIPNTAGVILNNCDSFIVGSAVFKDNPKDIDIVVPFDKWHLASSLIPKNAKPNSFGGWKFEEDGIVVDIWPDSIGTLLSNFRCVAIEHWRSGRRWFPESFYSSNKSLFI